jgi:hypothetical protein
VHRHFTAIGTAHIRQKTLVAPQQGHGFKRGVKSHQCFILATISCSYIAYPHAGGPNICRLMPVREYLYQCTLLELMEQYHTHLFDKAGLKNIIFTALTGVKLKICKPPVLDWFDRYQNHGNN